MATTIVVNLSGGSRHPTILDSTELANSIEMSLHGWCELDEQLIAIEIESVAKWTSANKIIKVKYIKHYYKK